MCIAKQLINEIHIYAISDKYIQVTFAHKIYNFIKSLTKLYIFVDGLVPHEKIFNIIDILFIQNDLITTPKQYMRKLIIMMNNLEIPFTKCYFELFGKNFDMNEICYENIFIKHKISYKKMVADKNKFTFSEEDLTIGHQIIKLYNLMCPIMSTIKINNNLYDYGDDILKKIIEGKNLRDNMYTNEIKYMDGEHNILKKRKI